MPFELYLFAIVCMCWLLVAWLSKDLPEHTPKPWFPRPRATSSRAQYLFDSEDESETDPVSDL